MSYKTISVEFGGRLFDIKYPVPSVSSLSDARETTVLTSDIKLTHGFTGVAYNEKDGSVYFDDVFSILTFTKFGIPIDAGFFHEPHVVGVEKLDDIFLRHSQGFLDIVESTLEELQQKQDRKISDDGFGFS